MSECDSGEFAGIFKQGKILPIFFKFTQENLEKAWQCCRSELLIRRCIQISHSA